MSAALVVLAVAALILLLFASFAAFSISVSLLAIQKALEAQNHHYGVAPAARTRGELQPGFVVRVDLDGDDDAAIQTGNARYALDVACKKMKDDGVVRDYTLEEEH